MVTLLGEYQESVNNQETRDRNIPRFYKLKIYKMISNQTFGIYIIGDEILSGKREF